MKISNFKFQIPNLLMLAVLIFLSLALGQIIFADTRQDCPQGLVPCGTPNCPCQLCDFFVMITDIIGWFVGNIVLPLGALMLIIGGIMFIISADDPKKVERAKSIITSTVIGLVIFFCGWLVISFLFNTIGIINVENILTPWDVQSFCPIN